jgi:hypothetical protein
VLAIALNTRVASSGTASIDGNGCLLTRDLDQPKIIATQSVHMRVNDGDCCCRCDHRLDCVTTIGEDA